MPELPEVETIRRQLAPHLCGRTIEHVQIDDPRWTRPGPVAPVAAGLAGQQVVALGRRGKYLDWELGSGAHLLVHLRMTGALLFDPAGEPDHARVLFAL